MLENQQMKEIKYSMEQWKAGLLGFGFLIFFVGFFFGGGRGARCGCLVWFVNNKVKYS